MGYSIYVDNHDFVIPAEHLETAYAAACALNHDPSARKMGGHFSWVDEDYDQRCRDMQDVLKAWRYEASYVASGDLVLDYFLGEKAGDDEQLFARIAPFVKSGSFIEYHGEEGEKWRYVFTDGAFTEQHGKTIWEG